MRLAHRAGRPLENKLIENTALSAALTHDPSASRGGKAGNVALWVLQIAAAAMLGMAGFAKLTGAPEMIALFEAVGIGQWFRYTTGGLEVLGAVLLLVPALAGVGALVLAPVMLGAVLAHLFVIGGSPVLPLVLLAVTAFIAFARRDRTLRLLGRSAWTDPGASPPGL